MMSLFRQLVPSIAPLIHLPRLLDRLVMHMQMSIRLLPMVEMVSMPCSLRHPAPVLKVVCMGCTMMAIEMD